MKRILVVDDEYAGAEVLSMLLGAEGYEVTIARNGQDGLAHMRDSRPDVVLTDHMMPVMDGLQMLADMMADPSLSSIPAIGMSSGRVEAFALHAMARGFCAKPIRYDALLTLLRNVLGS